MGAKPSLSRAALACAAALALFPSLAAAQGAPAETPAFAAPHPAISDLTTTPADLPPEAKSAAAAGIAALGKNKFEAAEAAFLKLLKLSPDNINALVNLGMTEYRLGRQDQAKKYLFRAVRVKPDAALAWIVLGIIDTDQDDLEGATAAFAQAVYLSPKNAQAHNYFAVALSKRGWYSAAEDELQRAVTLNPTFAEAHFNLALTYMLRTPPAVELARRHYERALELGAAPDAALAAKLDAAPDQTISP